MQCAMGRRLAVVMMVVMVGSYGGDYGLWSQRREKAVVLLRLQGRGESLTDAGRYSSRGRQASRMK